VIYDASAKTPCTVSVTGAGGLSLTPTPTYSNNTNAGTATAAAAYTFTGDANHTGSNDSQTFSIIYGQSEVQFLQPINGTAHTQSTGVSTFKAGSTVPVKVQVKLPNGTVIQPASAQWITPQKGGATTQPVDTTVYSDPSTSGVNYVWDPVGQFYQYNWGTPKNGSGYYWLIGVKLDDGQTYTVYISLK
jgi:hypothetical protein